MRRNQSAAGVFIATGAAALGEGILGVLLIPFRVLLESGVQEYGSLLTVRGAGGLVGGLIVGLIGDRIRLSALFPLSLVIIGGLGLVMFNLRTFVVALVVLFLVGIPAMGAQVSSQTLLQTSVEAQYHGRVFGVYGTISALFMLSGQGLAGALGMSLGTVPLLNVNACLYLSAALVALFMLRGAGTGNEEG